MIKLYVTSVPVEDQEKALDFYTQVLGFIKKRDVPMGEHKWLTVVSPGEQCGVELLLEPMGFAPARSYQQSLKEAGIPCTSSPSTTSKLSMSDFPNWGLSFHCPLLKPVRLRSQCWMILAAIIFSLCKSNKPDISSQWRKRNSLLRRIALHSA